MIFASSIGMQGNMPMWSHELGLFPGTCSKGSAKTDGGDLYIYFNIHHCAYTSWLHSIISIQGCTGFGHTIGLCGNEQAFWISLRIIMKSMQNPVFLYTTDDNGLPCWEKKGIIWGVLHHYRMNFNIWRVIIFSFFLSRTLKFNERIKLSEFSRNGIF